MEIGGRDLSPVPPPSLVAPAPDKETANEEVGVQREADHRDAGIAFVHETCTAVSSPSSNFQCAVRRPDGMPVYRNPVLRGEVAGDLLGAPRRNSGGICVLRPVGDGGANRINERGDRCGFYPERLRYPPGSVVRASRSASASRYPGSTSVR